MEFGAKSLFQASSPQSSRSSRMSSNCTTRKRGTLPSSKGFFMLAVVLVFITLQFSSPVQSASLNKRSADQTEEACRTSAICGWEVYHPSTRNLQYYVASSCKCTTKETCIRSEDDITISAWVFRCRDTRKRKTTRRPTTELNETS